MTSIPAGPCGMRPIHPGELVAEELAAMDMSVKEASAAMDMSTTFLAALIEGRAAVTPGIALRLGRLFGNGPDLWLALQTSYEERGQ